MKSTLVDEATIRRAAETVALPLSPEHVPGVIMYFRMIAEFAALVNEFPLDAHTEPASIFVPCSPPKPE